MDFKQYKISNIRDIGDVACEDKTDCIRVFRLIPKDGDIFSYKPGQFAIFEMDGVRRGYSIASSPSEKYLEFAIHLIGGRLTSKLSELKEGDTINIAGPYGNKFIYNNQKNVGLIGAGIGITPLMSILRYAQENNIKGNFTLFYSARNLDRMPYLNELKEIEKDGKIDFTFIPTLTRVSREQMPEWMGEFGRINERLIKKYCENAPAKTWFMCGSTGFVNSMKDILITLGTPEDNTLFEGWG